MDVSPPHPPEHVLTIAISINASALSAFITLASSCDSRPRKPSQYALIVWNVGCEYTVVTLWLQREQLTLQERRVPFQARCHHRLVVVRNSSSCSISADIWRIIESTDGENAIALIAYPRA